MQPLKGYGYLAVPYSHPDPAVQAQRYHKVCTAAAKLMEQGFIIFSPITHTIPLENLVAPAIKASHGFWMNQDLPVLFKASYMLVLTLPGWKTSKGVLEEIACAEEWGIPFQLISYKDVMKGRVVWES